MFDFMLYQHIEEHTTTKMARHRGGPPERRKSVYAHIYYCILCICCSMPKIDVDAHGGFGGVDHPELYSFRMVAHHTRSLTQPNNIHPYLVSQQRGCSDPSANTFVRVPLFGIAIFLILPSAPETRNQYTVSVREKRNTFVQRSVEEI